MGRVWIGIVSLLLACGTPPTTSTGVAPAEVPTTKDGLVVSVPSPVHFAYNASTLGAGGQAVRFRVTNRGQASIVLGDVSVVFHATRHNVAFECTTLGVPLGLRRGALSAGETVELEREIPCKMPLPGIYSVEMFAARGGEKMVAFQLELAGSRVPAALGGELFAILRGDNATRPLAPDAWQRGDYHVVVAFINGGVGPVALEPTKLGFTVYKKGSPFACASEAHALTLPATLASGTVHTMQVPIACAPSEEGQYEVVGRLSSSGRDEIEIGRFGLRVTRDPLLFNPLPLTP